MARTVPEAQPRRAPAGGRSVLVAVALAPILPVLAALVYYFATRWEADWVLVAAMGLCAAAIAGRLLAAFLPGRPRRP
ncbi:MAG: hypothetical protein WBF17_21570 [Phycisphaerae bacterium]